jgi:hypothetical protein
MYVAQETAVVKEEHDMLRRYAENEETGITPAFCLIGYYIVISSVQPTVVIVKNANHDMCSKLPRDVPAR